MAGILKKTILVITTVLTGALFAPLAANAQAYPARPVRIVVPFAPGSTTDALSRLLGQKLSEAWGQTVVIDNKPGAGGNIGEDAVAKATPDGYTIMVAAGSHTINPSLYGKLPFDAAKDFAPIAMLGSAPLLIVAHPSLPASNVRELIALAKLKPGLLNYASGGSGSPSHLVMELFKSMAGVNIVHVPYKGGAPVMTAILANEVQLTPAGLIGLMPFVKSGRLKAIATTGQKRSAAAPDIPTVAESGLPGYHMGGWWGVFAPTGTPGPVLVKLHADIMRVMQSPDVRAKFVSDGIDSSSMTAEEFGAYVRDEMVTMARVVKESGAKVD
jgi:tripartite-type tricarboxylate transporter receptor subunit TctC